MRSFIGKIKFTEFIITGSVSFDVSKKGFLTSVTGALFILCASMSGPFKIFFHHISLLKLS